MTLRDERDIDDRQGDRRKDQVLQEQPEILRDAHVSLHRQPAELERHQPDQQVGEHEHRHREAHHREAHQRAVEPAAEAPCRDHAEGYRHRYRDQDGQRGEGQRRLEALGDQRGHLDAEVERLAEVAREQLAQPDAELRDDRPVEAQALADLLDLLGVGGVAGHDRRRVARRQAQQEEYQHRDDQQDRDRRGKPPGNEVNQFFLRFQ